MTRSDNDLDPARLLRESLGTPAQREQAQRYRALVSKITADQAQDDQALASNEEVRALIDRMPPDRRAAVIENNMTVQEKAYMLDNGMHEPDPLILDEVAHRLAAKSRAELEAAGPQGLQERCIDRMQRTMTEDELQEVIDWGRAEQARTRSTELLASQAERAAKDFGIEDQLGQQRIIQRTMAGVENAHLAELSTDELVRKVQGGTIDLDDARQADARRRAERNGSAYEEPAAPQPAMTVEEMRVEFAAQGREGFEADVEGEKPVEKMSASELGDMLFDENGERRPEYQKPTQ